MTRNKRDLDLPPPTIGGLPPQPAAATPPEATVDPGELELLRRALIKISFAANGIHEQLDKALDALRQTVRSGGDSSAIQQKVDGITDVLRRIGDETSNRLQNAVDARSLLDTFLAAKLPEAVASELRKLHSSKHTGDEITAGIVKACLHWPEKDSLWQRWFGRSKATETTTTPEARNSSRVNADITDPLLRLIDSMQLPEPNRVGLKQLRQQFAQVHDPDKLVDLVEELASVLLDASAVEQAQFEQFLTQLSTRLAKVQAFLHNSSERDSAAAVDSAKLDADMRNQVQGLHDCLTNARDVSSLQTEVVQRLDRIVEGLDRFRDGQKQRQQRSDQELKALREQLRATEDEAARLRDSLSEQRTRAATDALTHIANRHAYHDRLNQEYSRWRRYRGKMTLVIADIDLFKQVNDKYGHMAGDAILKHVANLLRTGVRESDFVARYGGEEFVILMPETGLIDATKAINKLRQRIAQSNPSVGGQTLSVTVSFGVAEFEGDDVPRDVFHRADTALYRAKSKGRNQVCCERKGIGAAEETAA
ncbi:MAG: GGDEF domain-containing protein [Pseudomonadota bacterium]